MTLRTRLVLWLLLMSVVPLGAVTYYSYRNSANALRVAAAHEADLLATDMTSRMTGGVLQANMTRAPEPRMDVQKVADAVVFMANLPLDANVLTMTIMATKMPFVGRG